MNGQVANAIITMDMFICSVKVHATFDLSGHAGGSSQLDDANLRIIR